MAKVNANRKGKPVLTGKKGGIVLGRNTNIKKSKVKGGPFKAKKRQQQAVGVSTSASPMIQRAGKQLRVTQPINDLRQLIKTKNAPKGPANKNNEPTVGSKKQTSIKSRLGLKSASARNRAKLTVESAKNNNAKNGVVVIRNPKATQGVRYKGARPWRPEDQLSQQAQSILMPQVPPMVMIAAPNSVAAGNPSLASALPIGNQVVVSNLNPAVTQAEITELFSEIGPLTNVQQINSTTSMITYYSSAHASQAISEYNNRFLDGQPMQVTLIPSPNAQVPNVRRAFREAFAN